MRSRLLSPPVAASVFSRTICVAGYDAAKSKVDVVMKESWSDGYPIEKSPSGSAYVAHAPAADVDVLPDMALLGFVGSFSTDVAGFVID